MNTSDNSTTAMPTYRTGLGASDLHTISLLGHDVAGELMGAISFGELSYWMITKRRPTPQQAVLFEAVLVALADHGFTPTAIAARVTLLSAAGGRGRPGPATVTLPSGRATVTQARLSSRTKNMSGM